VLNNLGLVAQERGCYTLSESLWQQSLGIEQELGRRRGIGLALNNLGLAVYGQRDWDRARALFEQCLAMRREIGHHGGVSDAYHNLGLVEQQQRNYEAAWRLFRQSLTMEWQQGSRWGIANSLETLARLATEAYPPDTPRETWELTARWLAAAEALREAIGAPVRPTGATDYTESIPVLRERLGEDGFTAAWTEGRRMPLRHAVLDALGGPDRLPEAERPATGGHG
jgi:tetratricopeptide (TPR) repeat protein